MIVWTEEEDLELALSFDDPKSCDEFWTQICHARGKDPASLTMDAFGGAVIQAEDTPFDDSSDQMGLSIELPSCEIQSSENYDYASSNLSEGDEQNHNDHHEQAEDVDEEDHEESNE